MKILMFTKPKKVTLNCLKYLYDQNEDIVGVVIYDAKKYYETEFCKFCRYKNISIYDGNEIYTKVKELKNKIDLIYVNTYPKLIGNEIINLALTDAVNFHSAPLPDYKGVFGFNFAIYNQENEFGVTAHRLSDNFDEGDIIEVDRFPIDSSKITVRELVEMSEQYLYELFKNVHNMYKNGTEIKYIKQNGGKYYSRKDFNRLKKINSDDTHQVIDRKIKAFWYPPYEGAYVAIDGKKYTLVNEEVLSNI